jgi:hypothetical protein
MFVHEGDSPPAMLNDSKLDSSWQVKMLPYTMCDV